ncbi:MAG: hypothetical protein IPK83_07280 [Planctomycetes bacterium]|nr:hypothetical protein [Planctomycetota bacterium]
MDLESKVSDSIATHLRNGGSIKAGIRSSPKFALTYDDPGYLDFKAERILTLKPESESAAP